MLRMFLIVGLGSFFGGGSRFIMQQFITKFSSSSFPYGTLAVNIIGSFIIGLLFSVSERYDFMTSEVRLLLVTGFCGGFTTFSSFSLENMVMLRDGDFFHVFMYVSLSVIVGLFATYLGIQLIKYF